MSFDGGPPSFWPWAPDAPQDEAPWGWWGDAWEALGGEDWERFVETVSPSVQMTASAAAWWLADAAPDRLDWLTCWTLKQPELREAMLLASAGCWDAPERQLELQRVPAEALDRLDALWLTAAEGARETARRGASPADSALTLRFLDALSASWRTVHSTALFRRLAASALASSWSPDVLQRDADAAAAWLLDEPEFRRAWEVQRWGVADHPGTLVGNQYIRGLILSALHEAGYDQTERALALLAELPLDEPPRYYGDWRGIPPDADSLGLFLALGARFGGLTDAQVARWLASLRASLDEDGGIRTWLYRSPDGPTTDNPEQRWVGDDCPAVRLLALTGLVDWGAARDIDWAADWGIDIQENTEAAVERLDDGLYYGERYGHLLLARLASACERADSPLAIPLREQSRAFAAAITDAQALDGGWGSPQDTAFALETLALFGDDPVALLRGLRYLSERQYPDGSWQMDDFFIMPAKPPTPHVHYRSAEVTTALCLRALAAARARLTELRS